MTRRFSLHLLAGVALATVAAAAPAATDPATRAVDTFLATTHLNPRSPAEFTAACDCLSRPRRGAPRRPRARDRAGAGRDDLPQVRQSRLCARRRRRRFRSRHPDQPRPRHPRRRARLHPEAGRADDGNLAVPADLRPPEGDRREGRPGRRRASWSSAPSPNMSAPESARTIRPGRRSRRFRTGSARMHRLRAQHRRRPQGGHRRSGRARRAPRRLYRRPSAGAGRARCGSAPTIPTSGRSSLMPGMRA